MQVPASNLHPNSLHRLIHYGWTEVDEELSPAILRSPRSKRKASEIKFLVGIRPSPVLILAIDNLRLLRMKLQPTFPQTRSYGCPNLLGFGLRSAMHDGVIGETLKRTLRIPLRHPPVKSIMQKQIG